MKKSQLLRYCLFFLVSCFIVFACSKDETLPNDKSSVSLTFENRVGVTPLSLATGAYANALGEDFTVTTFNYFISNIALTKEDGSIVKFPTQYFLVRQADAKTLTAELKDVPFGNYQAITFTIGVDSTRSVSDLSQRTGVLDPTSYGDDGMYWVWNSGYIFMKIEGTSPVILPNASGKRVFQMHVGGFGGQSASSRTTNNLRSVTLPLTTMAKVEKEITPKIYMVANILKIFEGNTTIKLAETNTIHSPSVASPIADNYAKMFSINRVENSNSK
jgi:hypothetical protein